MEVGEILISAFLLLSVYWSLKPPDQFHMFGHGRAQNVAALVSAIIIVIFLSVETIMESAPRLFQGTAAKFQNSELALTVIIFAMIIGALPLVDIQRRKSKGPALKAQLSGVIIEEVAGIAALVGILLAASGYPWTDALASLIIGAIIAAIGVNLFKENVHYLIGKAPGNDFFDKVQSAVLSIDGVIDMHDLKAEYVGPNMVHADFHIEVAGNTLMQDIDVVVKNVEKKVSLESGCQYCSIHLEPSRAAADPEPAKQENLKQLHI